MLVVLAGVSRSIYVERLAHLTPSALISIYLLVVPRYIQTWIAGLELSFFCEKEELY